MRVLEARAPRRRPPRRLRRVVGGLRRRAGLPKVETMPPAPISPYGATQAGGRGGDAGLRARLRPRDGLPALLQRVRPAPGSEVRVRGGDPEVHHRGAGGEAAAHLRRRRSSRATSATSTTSSRRTSPRPRRTRARASGGVFNIGCGEAIDLNRVVALIGDILGRKVEAGSRAGTRRRHQALVGRRRRRARRAGLPRARCRSPTVCAARSSGISRRS